MTKSRKPNRLNVFICSAKEDLDRAKEIYFKLIEESWIRPWLYAENISPGQEWQNEISKELLNAHAIIICLSRKAVARQGFFQKEIKTALDIAKEVPQGNIFIIPLIINDCEIPNEIKHLYRLDSFDPDKDYEKLRQSLIMRAQSVKVKTDKPQPVKLPEVEPVPDPFSTVSKKLAMLILDEAINDFDLYRQNTIRFVLSRLLEVDEKYIVIRNFLDGSVKVVLELPEQVCAHLDFLWRNRDKDLLRLFRIRSFTSLEQDDLNKLLRESYTGESAIVYREEERTLFRELPSQNEIFVGREAELELFRQMLKDPYGDKRILLLLGGGGIGKTKLVKQMLFNNQDVGVLIPREPIDLFSTDYRHIDGIQWKIRDTIENLTGLKGEISPFASWVKGKTDTSEKFHECLKAFCEKRSLVLAFDTFENLDKTASEWLFKGAPDGLQVPGLICVVAGRDKEKEDIENYQNNPLVQEKKLSMFSIKEADQFFLEITNEGAGDLDDLLEAAGLPRSTSVENSIEWVVQITEGHPLRLEMVFRWLGTLLGDESLKDLSADKFEERLMLQVNGLVERGLLDAGTSKQISNQVFDTLLCMSYVTRRFDEDFLQYLINHKLIQLDNPNVTKKDIIDNLEQYFFIKVHQGNAGRNILQLHDEMARLLRKYVWPFIDSSGTKRSDLYQATIKFYDILIDQSLEATKDVLQNERLDYMHQ